ncbi:MAG: GNAT family N-acetyltransferase [Oligoflexia bacterium]|nr:GNAT family N-acetyltransferase [Oligoflexia bacterium]
MLLGNLTFEPLREVDFALLHKWLNTSHVMTHWGGPISLEDVTLKYRQKINSYWQSAYTVSRSGQKFGYVQSYCAVKVGNGWWVGEPETTFGVDQFIGDVDLLGQGLGVEMVRCFSDWLLTRAEIGKLIADPAPDNYRAIRCYESAGFKQVKLVATPKGQAVLMEKRLEMGSCLHQQ